jgi:hypothetical protein
MKRSVDSASLSERAAAKKGAADLISSQAETVVEEHTQE